jgi:putative flippase GtrA
MGRGVRIVISSMAASAADFVTLLTLVGLAHLAAGAAAAIGCLVGGGVNFALNRRWVFSANGSGVGQLNRYFLFVVLGGAVLVGGLVHLAVQRLGAPVLLARVVVSLIVLFGWNYPVSKHLVFREETSS